MGSSSVRKVAVIGNHTPRRCGLATFTADVASALTGQGIHVDVVAMNDRREGYAYPDPVSFEIFQDDPVAYRRAAEFLNLRQYDVVNVQHEFGIYGGPAGDKVLTLYKDIGCPIVTTLHTILREPTVHQRQVFEEILELSERVIVMSETGKHIVNQVYGYDIDRIDYVPHGVPDVEFQDTANHKAKLKIEERPVLLTFGLVSPDKGIENAIWAMPKIVEKFPHALYLVVGQTHPHIVERQGERYRERLEALVEELGLQENVHFLNAFVSFDDLVEYLLAADVYVTPYLKLAQITSGTLSYAVGCGKAIVSTPLWHAEELLAEDRGILVPPASPAAIGEAVLRLLEHPEELQSLREQTYQFGRSMTWPAVAKQKVTCFEKAVRASRTRISMAVEFDGRRPHAGVLPVENYDHLRALSDDTGMLQHAKYAIADRDHGYCTDDNARGLILAAKLGRARLHEVGLEDFASRYLGFLFHAFDETTGRFRNFMSFNRKWLEDCGSEDSNGRALWALGTVVDSDLPEGWRSLAATIFGEALPSVQRFTYARSWAFALLGLDAYSRVFAGDRLAARTRKSIAKRLVLLHERNSSKGWNWFEPSVTYDNARLPQALLLAGKALEDREMIEVGLSSLEWLCDHQRGPHGVFIPIGNQGFWDKNSERPHHDQQPLEAWATVSACSDAYRLTGNPTWKEEVARAFRWFLGENSLGQPIYDPLTGGCRDGLGADRVNENMGAESTLSYAIASLEMSRIDHVLGRLAPVVHDERNVRLS